MRASGDAVRHRMLANRVDAVFAAGAARQARQRVDVAARLRRRLQAMPVRFPDVVVIKTVAT